MRNPLLKVTVFLFCLGIGWAQQPPPTAQASTEGKNAQASKPVLCGAKIYIASMPDDLDGYIRAQFLKQHVPLAIVMDKGATEFVMTGGNKELQSHWYNSGTADHNTGDVTITDTHGNFVWAAMAGDRNMWWGNLAKHGPEKVAQRIVDQLKKSITPASCQAAERSKTAGP